MPAMNVSLDELQASAEAACSEGELERARALAVHVLSRFRASLWATRLLAQVFQRQGRLEESINQYRSVVSVNPLDGGAYLAMAEAAADAGQAAEAARFQKLADDHWSSRLGPLKPLPRSISTSRLAILQERSGLWPQAIDSLRRAIDSDPTRIDLHLLLARGLYLMRSFDQCQEVVTALLAASPDCLEGNILAAALCQRNGHGDEAESFVARAYACDPTGACIGALLLEGEALAGRSAGRAVSIVSPRETDGAATERLGRTVFASPAAGGPPGVSRSPERLSQDFAESGDEVTVEATPAENSIEEGSIPRQGLKDDEPEVESASLADTGALGAPAWIQPTAAYGPDQEPQPTQPHDELDTQTVAETDEDSGEASREMEHDEAPSPVWAESGHKGSLTGHGARAAQAEFDAEESDVEVQETGAESPPEAPAAGDAKLVDEPAPAAGAEEHEPVAAERAAAGAFHFPDFEAWFQANVLDAVLEPRDTAAHAVEPTPEEKEQPPAAGPEPTPTLDDLASTGNTLNDDQIELAAPATPRSPAPEFAPTTPEAVAEAIGSQTQTKSTGAEASDVSPRRWSMPSFDRRRRSEPIRSRLADLAETVDREPLNNGSRFELAQELETADPSQAVVQYSLIVASRDPRLVSDVRDRLEDLLSGGNRVHGLQRLLGDVCMQQGSFERAIECYSLAFDELRSRQITDGTRVR